METNKTVKTEMGKVIDTHRSFLTRIILTTVMVTSLSILSGCQDEMVTIKTENSDYPVLVEQTNPKPVPAQLASKITLKNISDEEMPIVNSNESYVYKTISTPRYNNTSFHNLKPNNRSWKETYDGRGIPLLKISF